MNRYNENDPAGGKGGYYPTGIGWYRKTFSMPPVKSAQRVLLKIDGVHMNSEVRVKVKYLGKQPMFELYDLENDQNDFFNLSGMSEYEKLSTT